MTTKSTGYDVIERNSHAAKKLAHFSSSTKSISRALYVQKFYVTTMKAIT